MSAISEPLKRNNVNILNDEGKPTLIFAHGFGTDQISWKDVVTSFNDYRIVLYDNVGGGKADPTAFSPNKYDSLHPYADDLISICDAIDIKDAIMVAHSVSGMISVLAAIKRPELFSKLIIIGASPRYLNDTDYIGGFDQATLDELYETMANNYYAWVSGFAAATMSNEDKPELAQRFANTLAEVRPDIAQSVLRVIFQSDYRSVLPLLNKPTLILQTKEDLAVPMAVAEYLLDNINNSTLKIVDAYGHFPQISAAQEIINAIKQYI